MQDILTISSFALNLIWTAAFLAVYLRRRPRDPQTGSATGSDLPTRFRQLVTEYRELLDLALNTSGAQETRLANASQCVSNTPWPAGAELKENLCRHLSELNEANQQLRGDLLAAQIKLAAQHSELDRARIESRIDHLTNLPNRRAFDERACELHAGWEQQSQSYAVALFDLDQFKPFNDEHGHATGDAILQSIGKVVAETRRTTDLAARIGGEEFGLLIPDSGPMQCWAILERYRKAIEAFRLKAGDQALSVTASFGVAVSQPNESLADLLGRADQALYAAKDHGRNQIGIHDGKRVVCTAAPGNATTARDEDDAADAVPVLAHC